MKCIHGILIFLLLLTRSSLSEERGEHHRSADGNTELIYLAANYALVKGINLINTTYTIHKAHYLGPPETIELTGDYLGVELVAGVKSLAVLDNIAIGTGLKPYATKPPKQNLFFVLNFKTGDVAFVKSKSQFQSMLEKRKVGRETLLLAIDDAILHLKNRFDSRK